MFAGMHTNKAARCSAVSLQAAEQLIGTAPQTGFWIMISDPHPPGNKAFPESPIPNEVKSYINDVAGALPNCRVVLIRQSGGMETARLFVAASAGQNSRLYEFYLGSYHEIRGIDFISLLNSPEGFKEHQSAQPLFLVCTNGKRDLCCSDLGVPFYTALHERLPERVYMSSHLGGHRFAPTVVHLPFGLYYGRLNPQSASEFADQACDGYLFAENLRGRAEYPPPVQAAEIYFLKHSGEKANNALIFQQLDRTGDETWSVVFQRIRTGARVTVDIALEQSTITTFESCAKPYDLTPKHQFRLITINGI